MIKREKILFTSLTEGTDNLIINLNEGENYESSTSQITVNTNFGHIYGVQWRNSNSNSSLTRTDDAALFNDPNPAINNGEGTSPFDNLMPWKGMKLVKKDENSLVAIPKFWYKITDDGTYINIQISDVPRENFQVSPAHMDRSDGVGERDWVYVGRYHCGTDYKSKTGRLPSNNKTLSTFRTGISWIGKGYYMWDYAILRTIQLLYIVEFADWNSQNKIGGGCGNDGSENMGYTDNMLYHTGTSRSSRSGWNIGIQYRYIEGLWDDCLDWIDGISLNNSYVRVSIKPLEYNDASTGYVDLGSTVAYGNNYISSLKVPSQLEYSWCFYPKDCGPNSGGVSDGFFPRNPCCLVGGSWEDYNINQSIYGLFYLASNSDSYSSNYISSRLQYLPQSAHEEIT